MRLLIITLLVVALFSCKNSGKLDSANSNKSLESIPGIALDTVSSNDNNSDQRGEFTVNNTDEGIAEVRVKTEELEKYIDSISLLNYVNLEVWGDSSYSQQTFELLSRLNNLERLKLHFNRDDTHVPGLNFLTSIKSIDLSGFTEQYFQDLYELKALKELHFEFPFFDSLPKKLFSLENLEVLSIFNGDIGDLPPEVEELKNLRVFKTHKTRVTSLPKEIGNLSNLEILVISGYKSLYSIPKEIGNLKNLKALVLWRNYLQDLPEELSNLDSLAFLNIGDNKFSSEQIEKIKSMLPNAKIVSDGSYPPYEE